MNYKRGAVAFGSFYFFHVTAVRFDNVLAQARSFAGCFCVEKG